MLAERLGCQLFVAIYEYHMLDAEDETERYVIWLAEFYTDITKWYSKEVL